MACKVSFASHIIYFNHRAHSAVATGATTSTIKPNASADLRASGRCVFTSQLQSTVMAADCSPIAAFTVIALFRCLYGANKTDSAQTAAVNVNIIYTEANDYDTISKLEIRSVEHGVCPIAEFTRP